MEVRGSGNADLHAARSGLQIPVTLCAGISRDVNAAGSGMRSHIISGILDFHFAASRISFHAAAGVRNADHAGNGFDTDVPFHVGNGDVAGSAGDLDVAAHVTGSDRATGRGQIGVLIDFFHANRAGGGVDLDRAPQITDILRARSNAGIHFRVVRNLNRVGNADVAQMRKVRTDANGVAALFDGRIRDGVIKALLRVVKSESRRSHLSVHVHFAIGASSDVHVAGGV